MFEFFVTFATNGADKRNFLFLSITAVIIHNILFKSVEDTIIDHQFQPNEFCINH